jgi:hypothetical protein
MDDTEFDELEEEVSAELRGESNGSAGPEGARGVLSDWGYWWCIK